jgi:Zn-dependent M28 family amino/carboxypeptidase
MSQLPDIDSNLLITGIVELASDAYEGRAPGSTGEARTVGYLVNQFKSMGLQPGNTDGSYVQNVPLVGIKTEGAPLILTNGDEQRELAWGDQVVAWTKHVVESAMVINSEMVFVGYGVVAPEYDWDDYKDVDVRGKTLVMLVNDPPVRDPSSPDGLDPNVFRGIAMTYYGRWTYKFEIAAERGAAAALIIHETEPAGYPFSVLQGSNSGERFDLVTPDKNLSRASIEGWIPVDQGRALLGMAGRDFDSLKAQARTRQFKPVPLGITASMALTNTLRTIDSQNVVARLEGRDPRVAHEHVIYTAHWDHLGVGPEVDGDGIYNGAKDNASGTAGLLEIARAFTRLPEPPRRSVLFLAVTAEEQGLLGSQHYSVAPIYPLADAVANINLDGLNMYGRTSDVTLVGYGASDLDNYVREAAGEQGRVVRPDPKPQNGNYYRSDHFNLASQGVPALFTNDGADFIGQTSEFSERVRREYTERDYHKPSDDVKEDWDPSGASEDLKLVLAVGYRVAEAEAIPEWSPGSEFRALREKILEQR